MISLLGTLGIFAALIGSVLLIYRGIRGGGGKPSDLESSARLLVGGATVAMTALMLALMFDDFSIVYTANHHAVETPFPFDIATAWAALEGSIVLWGLVLAGFTWSVYRSYQGISDRLGGVALAVMGGVGLFFFGVMATVANPFEVCTTAVANGCAESSPWFFAAIDAPLNGRGPNPLLQNHLMMAFHPPILYVGYVGLTVPFAYAVASLAIGEPGIDWLRRSHRSTLVAWAFLTLGILLGGWWAYEVLSWGGYWAWDPVENASLMPWLVATAFLHSALVQRRRRMLQAWNYVLVISAFALTILGTFLTRSGTINSVHSFTQSAIGPLLLVFLAIVVIGPFLLFSFRADLVASPERIDRWGSREGLFLGNNLLLAVYAFVVLVGTIYPLILEAFTGTQVGVGQPFFNRLAVPLSFALLLVMGFGPITPWRNADGQVVWARARVALTAGLIAGLITAVAVSRIGWVVLAVTLGVFVITAIIGLLVEQSRARSNKSGDSLIRSMRRVATGDPAFWGGQLSHIGVVLVAIGIALAANLGAHAQFDLEPGQNATFEGFTLTYESPFQRSGPGRSSEGARVTVTARGRLVGVAEPGANFFGGDTTGVSTPDVLHLPSGDLYLTFLGFDGRTARLTVDTSPGIWVLWLGGLITSAGGFVAYVGRRRLRTTRTPSGTVDANV